MTSSSVGVPAFQPGRSASVIELSRLRQQQAAAAIERLIEFLDASDPYVSTEIEDDDESEPSLGFLEQHPTPYGLGADRDRSGDQTNVCEGLRGDLEEEHDGCEPNHDEEADTSDDEPTLGWTVDGCMNGSDPEA
jgi:hypothetical protein